MKISVKLLILLGLLASNIFADDVITIAASPVPHAQILQQVKPILKKQGIDLQIKEFDDYIQPNLLVAQKQLDANFFQHRPYLTQFNKERGVGLVELVGVQIEPMGIYASSDPKLTNFIKTKKAAKLPKNLTVGVPNDTTNEGRALLLLQKNGLIKIKSGVSYPTKKDIIANPYDLTISELDPAMLPRAVMGKQLDLAVINSNYALSAKLNPLTDAILVEDKNSPYVNVIAIRKDELNQPKMKKLAEVMHSQLVKNYIIKTYKGSLIPAF